MPFLDYGTYELGPMPKFQYQYNDNRILCFVTNTGVRLLLTLKYKWSITNHAYTSSYRLDLEDRAGCCKNPAADGTKQ